MLKCYTTHCSPTTQVHTKGGHKNIPSSPGEQGAMACPSMSVVPAWGMLREGGKGSHWVLLQDGDEQTGPDRSLGHGMRTAAKPRNKEKERKMEGVQR